jgi:hypothetical protein
MIIEIFIVEAVSGESQRTLRLMKKQLSILRTSLKRT